VSATLIFSARPWTVSGAASSTPATDALPPLGWTTSTPRHRPRTVGPAALDDGGTTTKATADDVTADDVTVFDRVGAASLNLSSAA
jgi:hypothetical protein